MYEADYCYYDIEGYGINLTNAKEYLDFTAIFKAIVAVKHNSAKMNKAIKAAQTKGLSHAEALEQVVIANSKSNTLSETIFNLSNKDWNKDGLSYTSEGSCGEGDYLFFAEVLPWEQRPTNMPTTTTEAQQILLSVLQPYVKEGQLHPVELLLCNIDTYGCQG